MTYEPSWSTRSASCFITDRPQALNAQQPGENRSPTQPGGRGRGAIIITGSGGRQGRHQNGRPRAFADAFCRLLIPRLTGRRC